MYASCFRQLWLKLKFDFFFSDMIRYSVEEIATEELERIHILRLEEIANVRLLLLLFAISKNNKIILFLIR